MAAGHKILIWSLTYALVLNATRALLLVLASSHYNTPYMFGILVDVSGQFFLALAPACLFFLPKKGLNIAGWLLTLILVLSNLLCFHYEVVFGHLPGISMLYYLSELTHLDSSISNNMPPVLLLIETGIIMFLLFACHYAITKRKCTGKRSGFPVKGLLFLLPFISLSIHAFPNSVSDEIFWGTRNPLIWLAQSSLLNWSPHDSDQNINRRDIWRFQNFIGHKIPFGGVNSEFPLCSSSYASTIKGNRRSVILLIVEGLGYQQLNQIIDNKALMPNLANIADENLSFHNIFATGTKTAQAYPAIFSGLPASLTTNLLWMNPVPYTQGFPKALGKNGYKTAFFHGSDLAFENQRSFLKNIGFEYLHELDPSHNLEIYGWGYSDEAMFESLKNWIKTHHSADEDQPYFANLFTISTHDPYVLPDTWQHQFVSSPIQIQSPSFWRRITSGVSTLDAATETYHYVDHHIGKFYQWYKKHEAPKGTILVITGDHTPHLYNEGEGINQRDMKYRVPLIISGNNILSKHNNNTYQQRLGGLHDISSTILNLVGLKPGTCDQGLNLLMPDSNWPSNRNVYSVGGDELERVYIWNEYGQFKFDRIKNTLSLSNSEPLLNSTKSLPREIFLELSSSLKNAYSISHFLSTNNAFSPQEIPTKTLGQIEDSQATIIVSHRGNTSITHDPLRENTSLAIEEAIQAGFEWVEVDVHLTSDGIPILIHDNVLKVGQEQVNVNYSTLANLRKLPGYSQLATLEEVLQRFGDKINFLIEAKPAKHISHSLSLSRSISQILKKLPNLKNIIVDSFDPFMVDSIKHYCDCIVAIDAPYKKAVDNTWLKNISLKGISWIYVHYDFVDTNLILRAHELGLQVMAYTVNDDTILDKWITVKPDGIITDSKAILNRWNSKNTGFK